MNEKQRMLLLALASLYSEISEEVENDVEFNIKLADLKIFPMSIGDIVREIYDAVEEQLLKDSVQS